MRKQPPMKKPRVTIVQEDVNLRLTKVVIIAILSIISLAVFLVSVVVGFESMGLLLNGCG